MTTLKEFEEALREQGMRQALSVLEKLRERDRAKRKVAPARRVVGQRMTPELAHRILELHETTGMTQQEIAFELGVNQGRVNEVIKRGKWLEENPAAPEAVARDKAKARMANPKSRKQPETHEIRAAPPVAARKRQASKPKDQAQLLLGDL